MRLRNSIFGIVLAATITPLFSFAQALPEPAPFIIQEYEGVMWRYNLSADGTQYVPDKPVNDRGNLTEPVLTVPNDAVPPRQTLPPTIPRIPPQTPTPQNPNAVKDVICVFSGVINPLYGASYTCTYTDKNTGRVFTMPTIYQYPNGDGLALLRRPLENPDFLAIKVFNTGGAFRVSIPMDIMTGRPAIPASIVYPGILMAQMGAKDENGRPLNLVRLGGGNGGPLSSNLATFSFRDANSNTLILLQGLVNAGIIPRRKEIPVPLQAYGRLPCLPRQRPLGGFDPLLLQPNAPAAALPVQPLPDTGGLGSTPGGGGNLQSGGSYLGQISDWWAQNKITGHVTVSIHIDFLTLALMSKMDAPPPTITPGGAYNVYFSLSGNMFVISFRDSNKDGVYEASFLQLTRDPDNPVREFKTEGEFMQFIDELRRTPKPPLAPAK